MIGDREVAFLARDLGSDREVVLEGSDLETRRVPWSTFKIPNLVIALETGIAGDLDASRAWDPARRPAAGYWPDDWRTDQTLASAFRRSAVWYFQELALEVGVARYRELLDAWSYGNRSIGTPDAFWLDGSLRISVSEQVAFLADLVTGRLDVSDATLRALEVVSADPRHDGLHGKTGSGRVRPAASSSRFEGWYVGYVRTGAQDAPVVFALWTQGSSFSQIRDFRRAFAVHLLTRSGLLEP
ncbi:penicillin-binding transpeptidase domain-containing protein [Salinarimonas rosea]|uniref:penicillin-binding transpeptidase domain-containing protein n=1 Tax=Salinarimonas rosea TaxID=552063 RepID=UPI0012EC25F3|nr:penicillin-binding transpeptidase domain-containing protein [Salinarimonas rosea]